MKSIFKFSVLFMLLFSAVSAISQTPKFGHVDLQALIQLMPERADAEKKYASFQSELEEAFGTMQQEYQTKLMEYTSKRDSLSEIARKIKEEDLTAMYERIQTYQSNAGQQIQAKQTELLKPVFDKAEKAVKEVGAEQGLLYIFDTSSPVILYNSKESVDVLPLVKVKMGIQ